MRKVLPVILLLCGLSFFSTAQDAPSVSVLGLFGRNTTWQNHWGAEIHGHLPLCRFFEIDATGAFLSPKVASAGFSLRPELPLLKGKLFLEGSAFTSHYHSSGIRELVIAASGGFKFDYLTIQAGADKRFIIDTGTGWESRISEPLNLLYKVAFNIRPATAGWNIGAGVTNFNEHKYERSWQPMLFINGRVNITRRLSILADVWAEESGMFHLNAGLYGITARLGVRYKFIKK